MQMQTLGQTGLTLSSLCYGTMQFGQDMEPARRDRLMDAFRAAGGNFFDTAHCYCSWLPSGAGASERILGEYIKRRNCRDAVVIATKGAHPSIPGYRKVEQYMSAGRIAADIDDSLGRMQVDCIDLFWLHRDDPRVPVGEIIDMLNAEVARGRIRYYGGSNWTAERLEEANGYAEKHAVPGFAASQPRWNLACGAAEPEGAKRLEPGVLLALSEADAEWHGQSQLPVIPYAPTANGFFATGGARPESCRTPRGLARLAAARQVAADIGATVNQVALAWLLHQPFPVFPILGTSDPDHLDDALGAVTVTLTPEQLCRLTAAG